MVKIAIFNQKGGVAKTTTVVNIAASLVKYYNKKVLAVNCDSQVTLHQYLLTYTNPDEIRNGTVKDLFLGTNVKDIASRIHIPSRKEIIPIDMFVIPSEKGIHLWDIGDGDKANESLKGLDYDYCIFDLPPNLSGISIAALSICDYIIIPAIPDPDSLEGFGDVVNTVRDIRNNGGNPDLAILGVVFCKVEPYMTHGFIMDQIRSEMGELCFNTCIKNRSVIEQSRFYGTPVCYYSPKSEATSEYHRLTAEIVNKISKDKKEKRTNIWRKKT